MESRASATPAVPIAAPASAPSNRGNKGMAEQIHDGPLQHLAALSLKLAAMQKAQSAEIATEVLELSSLVEAATRELRQIIDAVYVESALWDLGDQLRELGRTFEQQSGIRCTVAIDPAHVRFDSTLGDVVYRSVGELLTNVRKHARANRVEISSAVEDQGNVILTVHDDGIGLSTFQWRGTPFEGGGFGLWSIEHALSAYGGEVRVDCAQGLKVAIVLPRELLASR